MSALKKIRLRQIASAVRRPRKQSAILTGLGLGKIGRERVVDDTPSIRGMVSKVAHMVQIVE